DNIDNCVFIANASQLNSDGDASGNACDDDDDNDTVLDADDNCPITANLDQADFDHDGVGDVCDFIFSDDFNDGNLTIPAWTLSSGTWTAITGDAVGKTKKKGELVSPAYTGCGNCTIEADISISKAGRASILPWFFDSQHFVEVRLA